MTENIAARAHRRTAAVMATGTVLALATAALIAGFVVLLRHRSAASTAVVTPSGTDSAASATAPPVVPLVSPSALDDVTWTAVAGARVPVSRTAGPYHTAGGRVWGFAQSPLGAVLAAAHVSLRLCPQVGPAVFGPTLREQVVGDNAAALAQRLEGDYEQARAQLGLPYGEPAGRLYSTALGYRVDLDTPTSATVRLLIEGPGRAGASVLVELRLRMRWVGADWTLVAPAGGRWEDATALVTNAGGYTLFPDGG